MIYSPVSRQFIYIQRLKDFLTTSQLLFMCSFYLHCNFVKVRLIWIFIDILISKHVPSSWKNYCRLISRLPKTGACDVARELGETEAQKSFEEGATSEMGFEG